MHRSLSGLPRVRVSFPGSPTKHASRSGPWAALVFATGVLLLIYYARIAGRIRLVELKDGVSSSSGGSASTSDGSAATPAAAGAAAHGSQRWPTDVLGIQSMQQGMDFAGSDVMRMLHERPQPGNTFLQPGLVSPAQALSSRPTVHGHVHKAGMADPVCWLKDHTDERLDSFMGWRLNRTRAGAHSPASQAAYTCAAADHPPLPFPGCHVFVNHK